MTFRYFIFACVALTVAGCNSESKALPQPAMAIAPGYIKLDSGKLIQVIGYEHCPSEGYILIGRNGTGSREKHCTLVGKGSAEFDISVGTTIGMVVERWRVIADSRSIRLTRPDGDGATVFVVKTK
ncbi:MULTISPECIES: hypothetical protein [Pseudomonas]|uniref:hypothetical protein n=1 Tax=Pseudomonas TaxID=286 RepID=UPI000C325936|nr:MULTISPECIES: hypothetical protein [Pseudomonas]PWC98755.1 hypothetical protein CX658_32180 [Pseudomonas amygdali pv. lachrymans]PWC98805.1 hypothetical protein CX658_31825 [Pseudomonas amygdali pv. lachrymans]WNZ87309.1 hypothetical protein QOM10_30635 [Pseudomonas sp. P108]